MKRSLLAVATALLLVAAIVPAATQAPSPDPAGTPMPPATPVPNGEVVIDPTFITDAPDPTATPAGAVAGATGRPQVTPPPTDTALIASTPSSASLQALSVLVVAVLLSVLLVGRRPGRRGT